MSWPADAGGSARPIQGLGPEDGRGDGSGSGVDAAGFARLATSMSSNALMRSAMAIGAAAQGAGVVGSGRRKASKIVANGPAAG